MFKQIKVKHQLRNNACYQQLMDAKNAYKE